ncbi:6826_t:CDS:10 [Diversispora eburnea]|uniref:6826_t:CDS:1 n=1 Tax=Diversispora eburnea TaxID=1213867 RepID=A0A9N9EZJ0_9GLOM|nr:6826_t:CDS:10 [Diversispora eburnea]
MKIAIEGCCHNTLEVIYQTIDYIEKQKKIKIDLLLICGDFQSIRNSSDLESLNVPQKYRTLGNFHKYYSGELKAHCPTLFIGGNHEASNYLWELYHGGWVCDNIYYLGCAGVVNFGGLRIGGLGGIYNNRDYYTGHYEKMPYSQQTIRSIYHLKQYDVAKLMQIKKPIDIFMSHDWPLGITSHGDEKELLRIKPFFKNDILTNKLGSPPGAKLLSKLKPKFWFSAHLHVKFTAVVYHDDSEEKSNSIKTLSIYNPDEISMESDENENENGPVISEDDKIDNKIDDVSFTQFLALDKCLPGRDFLQILDFPEANGSPEFSYDEEWLAITKATHDFLSLQYKELSIPCEEEISERVEKERQWILENISDFNIPKNFQPTAPPDNSLNSEQKFKYDLSRPFLNPQTVAFTNMLKIENKINPDGQTIVED